MSDTEIMHVENPHLECQREITHWKQEAGKWETKFKKLEEIYNKLADQWNALQATARPDNRNLHRAEAAGEVTRKLSEVLIALAYDKDAGDLLVALLEKLREAQDKSGGRDVEVYDPRALPTAKRLK